MATRSREAAQEAAGPLGPEPASEEHTVGYHMTRSTVTIGKSEPIMCAHREMAKHGIGCLPVFDGPRVVGIVTERKLIQCAVEGVDFRNPVGTVAVRALTTTPGETILEAIARLHQHHARYLLVKDANEAVIGLISQTDLLEASRRLLARAEENLEKAENVANRDEITGLFVRRVFEARFRDEFQRARRYGGLLALLLLDLDGFKHVNDEFGHPAGDDVLRRAGELVRSRVRRVDVPARYGGDEFTVLMPESGTRAAAILGDRVRQDIEEDSFSSAGRVFSVTVSGGVCKYGPSFEEPADMLAEADRQLYRAKRAGRNRIEIAP